MRASFARRGAFLDADEDELRSEEARQTPDARMQRGLHLSQALLADYRRLLCNQAFAVAEDERAIHKADLHDRWRAWQADQ